MKDPQAHRGQSLIIAGDGQPPIVHALAHAMNAALGNVGTTVVYTQTAEPRPMNQLAGLRELVGEMNAGTVEFLLILGGNPVHGARRPRLCGRAREGPLRASLGLYEDETSAACHWHIPETHYLEMWSDVRADDGMATIVQPLIAPLYNGKSAHEVLAALSERGERSGYELVREYWAAATGLSTQVPTAVSAPAPPAAGEPGPAAAARPPLRRSLPVQRGEPAAAVPPPIAAAPVPQLSPFDREWRKWLHDGLIPNTAFAPRAVSLQSGLGSAVRAFSLRWAGGGASGLEVVFRPDPSVRRPLFE